VDRAAQKEQGVATSDVLTTLQTHLGGLYVNDFNRFGRTWQVVVGIDFAKGRRQAEDLKGLQVRNTRGQMVPLGAFVKVREVEGPAAITRHDMRPAVAVTANLAEGVPAAEVRR